MTLLFDTLALFFAFVLIAAAIHKLLNPHRIAAAVTNMLRVSPAAGAWLWKVAAIVELIAGAALVIRPVAALGFLLAAGLWLLYAAALLRSARAGEAFDCGCTFGTRSHATPGFIVVRAFAFAVLAATAGLATLSAIPPSPFGFDAAFDVQAAFAAAALFSLHLAAGEIAVSAQSAGARR